MPLKSYGVLRGRPIAKVRETLPDTSPHYQIHVTDPQSANNRGSVNVLSQQEPSELLYLAVDDFHHPLLASLPDADGWTELPPRPGSANLDYIRGNLFTSTEMRALPPDVVGPSNDLADRLDYYVERAIADPTAALYAFGDLWGPEVDLADKIFGFLPGNGVHDIHMNQGNAAQFTGDDGVWQDGGLLINFPGELRWVAVFLAFQSQAWHTDDSTGSAISPSGTEVPGDRRVRIVGALVNPAGPAPESESVTILNVSASPLDLSGWHIANRQKNRSPVTAGILRAGATTEVTLEAEVALGNNGGAITLLDNDGLKVDGVAYTADDVRKEGWTVTF